MPDLPAVISVPDVRDYVRINGEIVRLLNRGEREIRLARVERQRLLVSGLTGHWRARIVVEGDAGPELCANLAAPGLTVICSGTADDGAGSQLQGGRLLIKGNAGAAVGFSQSGGLIVVANDAGPRAGLRQQGGLLVVCGSVGPLAAERQQGGQTVLLSTARGPIAQRGPCGGTLAVAGSLSPGDCLVLSDAAQALGTDAPDALLTAARMR